MIASRRVTWNFALDRAVEWAEKLQKPLVILEALRCGYPWASDRMHRFVTRWNGGECLLVRGHGRSLLSVPGARTECRQRIARRSGIARLHCGDGRVPLLFSSRAWSLLRLGRSQCSWRWWTRMACFRCGKRSKPFQPRIAFRRFLQRELPRHLMEFPKANALLNAKLPKAKHLPREITKRWPKASPRLLNSGDSVLAGISLDHGIPPVETRGGSTAAQALLRNFLRNKLPTYAEARNEPAQQATSELSPYLHFGHISVHQIFSEITRQEGWSPDHLAVRATGSRTGWWGTSQATEAFLDQVITWRELGFNCCQTRKDYDQFESLPAWALKTLRLHARDERSYVYTLEKFERAKTHDPLWNAAQTQLLREGRIHNYLRMLWGKKILEWTRSPAKGTRNHGGAEQ